MLSNLSANLFARIFHDKFSEAMDEANGMEVADP
jgi:hypothetical protein